MVSSHPSAAFTISIFKLVHSGCLGTGLEIRRDAALPVFARSSSVKTIGPSAPSFHNL